VKYGAFSNDKGSIHIAWTVEQTPEGPQLVLLWQEKDGPPVSSPFQTGFGSKVIERGLAYELKGTAHLDYQKDGVVCKMVIPMAAPNFAEYPRPAVLKILMLFQVKGCRIQFHSTS
jgi:two-component sensor histidine kinase